MKKLALLLLLTVNGSFLFAQKADTIKRKVDGTLIISTGDIVESMQSIKELSKFVMLFNYSGLSDTIKDKYPVTIFAPNNEAIDSANTAYYYSFMKPAYKRQLADFLKCYIVQGRITAKDIAALIHKNKGEATLTTISGCTLTATINSNRNIVLTDINGHSSVISVFDIQQKNGILDIITSVLFPLKPPG